MIAKLINFKTEENIVRYLYSLSVDPAGINIMKDKLSAYSIEVRGIRVPGALILKQELLSLGGDLAIPKDFIVSENIGATGTALIFATKKQLNALIKKIRVQRFGLDLLSKQLVKIISKQEIFWRFKNYSFNCSANNYHLTAIINTTPDSFYDGGKLYNNVDAVLKFAENKIKDGAEIFDVGGESTRPGSIPVDESEEINRAVPAIKELKKNFPNIPVSIDTVKFNTAKSALDAGADIINDISGLTFEPRLGELASEYKAGLILTHMKGTPETMQINPDYENLMNEIIDFLSNSIEKAGNYGVLKDSILIDPGIGFGKTAEHNLEIISRLNEFKLLGTGILIGLSNKSLFGKILNLELEDRIVATAAANALAFKSGASVFRVHNIKENKTALEFTKKVSETVIKN
ncbi:MAG TPA: dihydropteroate synthase [bacterium]|nr:dihydropteroate synthase [bacterium]HPN29886.1 dihydropteroate synthase [bacterium]